MLYAASYKTVAFSENHIASGLWHFDSVRPNSFYRGAVEAGKNWVRKYYISWERKFRDLTHKGQKVGVQLRTLRTQVRRTAPLLEKTQLFFPTSMVAGVDQN